MRFYSWIHGSGTRVWGVVLRERCSVGVVYTPTSVSREEWRFQDDDTRVTDGFLGPVGLFFARWDAEDPR